MKALLKKEFRFLHPACYLSFLFVSLLFIPNYPIAVVFFFPLTVSINIFLSSISENNDLLFCSLLPIRKKDYVRAKLSFILFFELAFLLLSLPLLITRNLLFKDSFLPTNPGIDSILSVYGFTFLVYGLYNVILLTVYFHTAPKRHFAYIVSLIVAFVAFTFFGVILAYIPIIGPSLDYGGDLLYQYLYFFLGLLLFIVFNYVAYKVSCKELKKKDF